MNQRSRRARFDALFEGLPGTNADRIRTVCDAILCKPNTVRTWRMRRPPRVISARSLAMLELALRVRR